MLIYKGLKSRLVSSKNFPMDLCVPGFANKRFITSCIVLKEKEIKTAMQNSYCFLDLSVSIYVILLQAF